MSARGDDTDRPRLDSREASESDPLLPQVQEPTLYRTLSRRSEAEHLPPDGADVELAKASGATPQTGVYATISVLLLGAFISQLDISFVMATYGDISSEFNDLESGIWLMTAYILAQCVAQPLYGKLGDIYGRKACLQTSYILFALGTAVAGLGRSMSMVILGRAIQGAGGAGMLSLVSIIITDIVPVHDVARLRSYVNVVQTTGRSCGGVIGGLLTQSLGWRWAFLVQIAPTLIAIGLVQWKLHIPLKQKANDETNWQKLKRIDVIGAALLCYAVFCLCFVLDLGGQKYPWSSTIIIAFIASGTVSLALFLVSARYVPESIFPLRLVVHFDVITNYFIIFFQVIVQFSLMMSVPIYFQAVRRAKPAEAGLYLIPAFVGNTLGALLAGHWIRRTGRYKLPTVLAPLLSVGCMALCLLFWNGSTSPWQSLTVFPGGFAQGMVASSAFVGIAAGLPSEDIAVAASGMYLFFNIGGIAGASLGAAAYQATLRPALSDALDGVKGKQKIIRNLLEDINNIQQLSDGMRKLVLPAYVKSFHAVSIMGLVAAGLSLIIGIFSREVKLTKK